VKAVVATRVGGPEVLEIRDLPEPQPGPGQVSIEVAYAGLNFADVMGRRGDLGPQADPFVPGMEIAGHIAAVGDDVGELQAGQAVCAFTDIGGYAEVAVAQAALTFAVDDDSPDGLLRAACTPTIGITAWSLLRHAGRLAVGETLLVHAAAGGLGTLVAQFARHLRAGTIIGTVGSAAKADYAHDFGYDDVLLREDFASRLAAMSDRPGLDLVLDSVGGPTREQSLRLLAPYGRLVACGNATQSKDFLAGAGKLMGLNASVVGYSVGALAASAPHLVREAGLEALDLLDRGIARIDITEIIELDDIRSTHRRMEAGQTLGKLAIRLAGPSRP
jgi:NADPH2:quinone reductase